MKQQDDSAYPEAALYAPIKALLERQGHEVKGEVKGCDLVARRGDKPPIIVELKRRFNLPLVLPGIDRLALTERVYLAAPRLPGVRRTTRILQRNVYGWFDRIERGTYRLTAEGGRAVERFVSLPLVLP